MAPFVLIVEDEKAIAWVLRTACERLGCRVVVCAEAESALKHAQCSIAALILLDPRAERTVPSARSADRTRGVRAHR